MKLCLLVGTLYVVLILSDKRLVLRGTKVTGIAEFKLEIFPNKTHETKLRHHIHGSSHHIMKGSKGKTTSDNIGALPLVSKDYCRRHYKKQRSREAKMKMKMKDANILLVLNDTQKSCYKKGDRYFYMAGDDGLMHLVDSQEQGDKFTVACFMRPRENIKYYLYTENNPHTPETLVKGDIESFRHSNFSASKVTVFISHGWLGDYKTTANQLLTEAFLIDDDVNVIVLDWSKLAKNICYPTVKSGVAVTGRTVGKLIKWMFNNGLVMYHRIHLVGFSLGGHVVGNIGKELRGAVTRITALDPAGPLWYGDKDRLKSKDAQYVEVIHTNTDCFGILSGWGLGYRDPCGDADFYPNGGGLMPGCRLNSCSHYRAYEYMAASLKYDHIKAYKCPSYDAARNNKCWGYLNYMGNSELFKHGHGIFRGNTETDYPY